MQMPNALSVQELAGRVLSRSRSIHESRFPHSPELSGMWRLILVGIAIRVKTVVGIYRQQLSSRQHLNRRAIEIFVVGP
jgi:hypothetical protein